MDEQKGSQDFLCRLLSKNKYPEIKFLGINQIDIDPELVERLERIDQIEKNNKVEDELDVLTLGIHYLGWNGVALKLEKAVQFCEIVGGKNCSSVVIAVLAYLMMSELINYQMSYQTFQSKLVWVIDNITQCGSDMKPELLYRLYRLISGWVYDHYEYQLSQDLMTLSEWIGDRKVDPLVIDTMINRWMAEGKKNYLWLIRFALERDGYVNQKLDSLVGINNNSEGDTGNARGNLRGKRNLSLVMRMGK